MKVSALFGIGAPAGTTMQEHHRLARGVAAFLVVNLVDRRNLEPSCVVGFDRRIEPCNRILDHGCRQVMVGHREQYRTSPNTPDYDREGSRSRDHASTQGSHPSGAVGGP